MTSSLFFFLLPQCEWLQYTMWMTSVHNVNDFRPQCEWLQKRVNEFRMGFDRPQNFPKSIKVKYMISSKISYIKNRSYDEDTRNPRPCLLLPMYVSIYPRPLTHYFHWSSRCYISPQLCTSPWCTISVGRLHTEAGEWRLTDRRPARR